MRILVTSSRMPFALDEIRKLGKTGHHVVATDTFRTAPGSHTHYAAARRVTASPRFATRQFIDQVVEILVEQSIDLVLPSFEEAFYLAFHEAEISPYSALFTPSFEVLAQVHDKARFLELAGSLGIRTPPSVVAQSHAALCAAIETCPRYFARPVYSRGGVRLLTNAGPLAGVISLEDCQPTATNPWLVTEFVNGSDVCTFSIAHHGRLTAHAVYVHPREIEHAGGIVFESIEDAESLAITRAIVERTGYHGQISLDFLRTDEGLVLIECNPRPTAGVLAFTPEAFADALFDRNPSTIALAPAGVRHKYSVALVRDLIMHWREARLDLEHLFSAAKDVYAERGDVLPALYQLLSYSHVLQYRRETGGKRDKRADLLDAYFYDICWNGEAIESERRTAPRLPASAERIAP
jgi:hypothetical protein